MAFKSQKKGFESVDGTSCPNSFNDFESEHMICGELRLNADIFE